MLATQRRIARPLLLTLTSIVALAYVSVNARTHFSIITERSSGEEVALIKKGDEQLSSAATPDQTVQTSNGLEDIANLQRTGDELEVEVLTLNAAGFDPAEMKRPAGRFMLAITNRTDENELSLELNQVAGNKLHSVRMGRGRTRSLSDLNLAPGEYILSERNHPRWICRLSISPK